ncbi:MAG: glutamate ligase domain-containing protein, partial [Alphaproteobacteria bacterium]
LRPHDCTLQAASSAVRARIGKTVLDYSIGAPGRHIVLNSLAVLGAVHALDGDVVEAARAMGEVRPLPGRGLRRQVDMPDGAFLVIDESYNANPTSMRAAIAVLGNAESRQGGRRIAVIGDMLELGPSSPALHADLAPDLEQADIDLVFTAGPDSGRLFDALAPERRGARAADSAALAPMVAAAVRPGDAVMVKGSAGSRMGRVVDALLALAEEPRDKAPKRANGG